MATKKFNGGMRAIGAFLFFGAAMASLAGYTLLWRGSFVNRVWALNPAGYAQLARFGPWIGIPFLFLALMLVCTGVGWFGRRRWAWRLAGIIIAAQVVGEMVNALRGEILAGAFGVTIAGLLLVYLLRPAVRAGFEGDAQASRSGAIAGES
jgi:hypothetical protein